jgi:hypothetical protein
MSDNIFATGDGVSMNFLYLRPGECTDHQIKSFRSLVLKGDQIQPLGLTSRILKAEFLAFAYEGYQLVAIGSLKNPARNYHRRVFQKAEVPALEPLYPFEAGYAFTEIPYRGRGLHRQLLGRLLVMSPAGVYATTKADNVPYILEQAGFQRTGKPFLNLDGETLHLFTFNR